MDFWRAYRVLTRRKWIIIAAVLLTTSVVGGGLFLYGRQYDATTSFGPTDTAVRNAANAGNDFSGPRAAITDHVRVQEASSIAKGVTAANNVSQAVYYLAGTEAILYPALSANLPQGDTPYDEFVEEANFAIESLQDEQVDALERQSSVPLAIWSDYLYLVSKMKAYDLSTAFLRPDRLPNTVADLLKKTSVELRSSKDVVLSVRNNDQRLAEILVNALTIVYKHEYDQNNIASVEKQRRYYAQKREEAQNDYNMAQAALLAFRQTNGRLFSDEQVSNAINKGNSAKSRLEELQGTLKDLDAQIAAKKARLASMPRTLERTTQVPNPEIGKLRDQMSEIQADLAARRGTQTEANPEVQQLKARLESVTQRYEQVKNSLVTNRVVVDNEDRTKLESEIATLEQSRTGTAARIGTLNQIMAESAGTLNRVPMAMTQAQQVNRAATAATEHLADISSKLRAAEDDLQRQDANGALQVRYWAGLPPGTTNHLETPARVGATKRNAVLFLAAFLISLLASAGIILALDFLDTSIKTPFDAERMLDVPVTGIVPRLDGPARAALPMVTHNLPASPHAESYRFLGTDILLSAENGEPFKSIMVATAKPGQGGTSTICNLAITLAQSGQTVALVDADLRRPSLHRIFSVDNDQGLTTVLENGRLPSDVLQRTEVENLYVMPGGPKTENAWKLLRSNKMKDVIMDLSRDFDFVLFDTPSAVVFADAATLATMVDGVLLVVRAHEAPSGSELQVKNLLNKTQARIVGVVLNDMPAQQVDSARFYNHYYAPGAERQEMAASSARPALPNRSGSDDEI